MDQLLHETDKNRQMANQIIRLLFRYQDYEQRILNATACVSGNHPYIILDDLFLSILNIYFSFFLENIPAEKYYFTPREVICHLSGKAFFSLYLETMS